ncbi:2OG-Fe(II) oxygenase [Acidihalobacter ferrooxydans]|uniref:Proline hydroxylase n=1 Tax=Acidihalobacter ferrooxydans TaxID=1765967 RepID=A0A1P8UEK0_9GAMM|nr:2OG-Fe(II) oxygenase [Acidihalobacter ferrooxydans]APZ42282.1 proline hydroxylase [Acidihalobacter ferrooxydans]
MNAEAIPHDSVTDQLTGHDWSALAGELNGYGYAVLKELLPPDICRAIASLYTEERHFRSRVHMVRHGFGIGEYRYFRYPFPAFLEDMRSVLYAYLAPIANEWNERMGIERRYPEDHGEFLKKCHTAGQKRPTPLLLKYGAGDYNCLHQDVYGDLVFPLQAAILLSQPGVDYEGGEFVLTEQRPRMQSRVEVVSLRQGDAVVFAVQNRPVHGTRGDYRINMRHGVSRVRSGQRYMLGLIFHDAT